MNVHSFIFSIAYQYQLARLKRCEVLSAILHKQRTREAFVIRQVCELLVKGQLDVQSTKIAQTIVSAQGRTREGKKRGTSASLFIFDSWLGLLWGEECLSHDSVRFEPGHFEYIHKNASAARTLTL